MKRELSPRKNRALTRHELDLWLHVTRDVTRSSSAPRVPGICLEAGPSPPLVQNPKPRHKSIVSHIPSAAEARRSEHPPLAPMEPKVRRRLSRGQISVDAVLDLHGLRQEQAHGSVVRFLHDCHANGARIALIVTGKGSAAGGEWDDFRRTGVLRQIVPHWLCEPALRRFVIGFEEAAPSQGGYGALYVRIRRSESTNPMGAR
jgi:DNA-nicking Smr family endonuclease